MRWSIQELFMALSWQWTGWWWRKLTGSPKSIYRNIETIFHWIFTGYTGESLWSLDWWLNRVIYFRLKKFAAYDRMGYPGQDGAETEEQWQGILNNMTEGFRRDIYDVSSDEYGEYLKGKRDEGLGYDNFEIPQEIWDRMIVEQKKTQEMKDLFWKWYGNLWD